MSVATLAPASPLAAALASAQEAVRQAGSQLPGELSNSELEEGVQVLTELESQVQALRLSLASEGDARGAAILSSDTGADAWLARLTGEPREVMAGGLWLARVLQRTYHHTRQALEAGDIRLSQAKVIVRAAERAPEHLSAEQVADAEALLVGKATGANTRSGRPMPATRLRQEARRMFAELSRELADQMEADQLGEEETFAERQTYLSLGDNGDGTWSGHFVIPDLQAVMLRGLLERLSAPRRLARDGDGPAVLDESAPRALTRNEHLGLAFVEVIEHLPRDGFGSANAATLVVHIDHDRLVDALGGATLDGGVRVSASQARRLACEARILPLVLGGDSVPLDLGRGQRLHSHHQRLALSAGHDTCAVGGCERPFAWCEVHHPHPWSHGGATDLANAVPLCGFHHRRAHDAGFDLRHHASGEWRFHRRR